jgi:hypothetical protein
VYDTVVDRPETWRGLRDGLDDQRTLRSGRMGVRDLATTLERFAGRLGGVKRKGATRLEPTPPPSVALLAASACPHAGAVPFDATG